jgi:hypothetical protein
MLEPYQVELEQVMRTLRPVSLAAEGASVAVPQQNSERSFRSSRVPLAPRPSPVAATPLHFSPAKSSRAASRAARPSATPSPALPAHPRASTPVPAATHTHSWGSSPVKLQAGASADRKTRDRWQKGGGEQGGGSSDEAEDAMTRLAIDDEFRESGGTVSRRVVHACAA